jgi:hypothetical protein
MVSNTRFLFALLNYCETLFLFHKVTITLLEPVQGKTAHDFVEVNTLTAILF